MRAEGLDVAQDDAVTVGLDPFKTVDSSGDPDVILGTLSSFVASEFQGPSNDQRLTAVDRSGRLFARFGDQWLGVPGPQDVPVRVDVQRGFAIDVCWRDVVRPAMHQALRSRGSVAIHAAAVDGGRTGGTLISGWSESGKTEVALAMVEAGANFLSDKWTVAAPDGHLSAFPVGVGVRGWALAALPRLHASLPARARSRFAAVRYLRATAGPILRRSGGRFTSRGRAALVRALELGDRSGLSPTALHRAYGDARDPARRTNLETVVVLVTGATDRVIVEDSDPGWAARRLARTAAYERRNFYDLQERAAYAGLTHRSGARDRAIAEEQSLLSRTMAAARVLRVTCPFPGDPRRVVEALEGHQ